MWRGNNNRNSNTNGRSLRPGRGNSRGQPPSESPFPPPPPFSSQPFGPPLPPPPPPPPALDRSRFVKLRQVPYEPLPYRYDPYGGVPRHEDRDPYNTSQPPPQPVHHCDLPAASMSFRDVVLSVQSWGARWPEPTDTSVKRWARRALRVDAPAMAKRAQSAPAPPAATSTAASAASPPGERTGDDANAREEKNNKQRQKNEGKRRETGKKKEPNGAVLRPQPPLSET